ncbi:MAG: M23 family metallopeptidase [Azoarcus sp.]|nr:M23 family metallopeptidase [Azoarcus sp.]
MALVILSMGRFSRSRVRTLSSRALVLIASGSLLAVAAGAFALGVGVGRGGSESNTSPLSVDHPEGRFLVDRLGEISGKLVRLESEALSLARRVGVIKSGEPLLDPVPASGEATPSGSKSIGPTGGPMIPASGVGVEFDGGLSMFDDNGAGLTDIEYELERLGTVLFEVERAATELDLALMAYPNRNPVPGGQRNSSFGTRIDPFNGRSAFHSGLDFQAPSGTPILASGGGRVIFSGYHRQYGYMVEIDHGNSLVTRYAHCSRLFVKAGDLVTPSQRIAAVGSTGRSTGAHLHFEILRNGTFVNPATYLARS